MPTRYLKQGICDSAAIDALSPMAENLFYRLLVNVDDYGRMDARTTVIRARCFPLKEDLTIKQVEKMARELSNNSLILFYEVDGKPYLQMQKWVNVPRAKESKFPPFDGDCIQMYTDEKQPHTNLPLTGTGTVTGTVTGTDNTFADANGMLFSEFWASYPKKVGKTEALKAWGRLKQPKETLAKIAEALVWQKESEQWRKDNGKFIPNPATYLNQGRWQDEPMKPRHDGNGIDQWLDGTQPQGVTIEGQFTNECK